MLTGVTVMGQAMKAKEFDDRLRVHGIRSKFGGASETAPAAAAPDHAAQLKQIAELRDAGVLTEEEFAAKKSEILARM
ncbi:MAG: SHOCT domain-containing protein [Acidobacteria bacterium]|nr:SHOCT domain-containing protein [Acidobacteriota bacterium]